MIGPILFVWLMFRVYKQVVEQKDIDVHFSGLMSSLEGSGKWILILVVLIMLIQWMLEARKWQIMLKETHAVSFFDAFKMIFSGIAISIATPNRIGEFAGRVLHLPSGTRLQGTAFTVIGNFAQLLVTCIAGSIALVMEQQDQHIYLAPKGINEVQFALRWLTPLAIFFFFLVYFKTGTIFHWIMTFRIMQRFRDGLAQIESISNPVLIRVLLLSCVRFLFFILQYWLLFKMTGTGIDLRDTFAAVSIMLLWLAIVPTFSLLELGLRWEFALLLLTPLTNNALGIAVAVTAVWFINLILPAAIGAFGLLLYRRT